MSTKKGGFYPGLILGFLLGVATSLGVALYVTKTPLPFQDKVTQPRTRSSDAEPNVRELNAPLEGRSSPRPASPPPAPAAQAPAAPPQAQAPAADTPPASGDPSALPPGLRAVTPGSTPDPATLLGDKPTAEAGVIYFVQTGAFARIEDAEQQRARLAMMGLTARITERAQTGRTVYRVRLGPFEAREDAESAQTRVVENGLEAALVRVQR